MGAPKQKWTPEEESALKAGMAKHGTGKWSTILKDPEFSCILFSRSNVDLKDKWRNIRVIPTGRGFRENTTIPVKKSRKVPKLSNTEQSAPGTVDDDLSDEIVDVKPLAMSPEVLPIIAPPQRPESKLENLILEAVSNLKEPTGPNRTTIAMYIEANCASHPDIKLELSGQLKIMTETGKLIKVKHNYRIAPSPAFSRADKGDIKVLNKADVNADLALMKFLSQEKATAAAAQAVAEAEAAMAEAEEAMRLAEAAEADVEEAQAFVEAASVRVKKRKCICDVGKNDHFRVLINFNGMSIRWIFKQDSCCALIPL